MNKFLHPPMQALKQAARENDSTRLDALCEAWSVSAAIREAEPEASADAGSSNGSETGKAESQEINGADAGVESRR
jgi:glutamyl-tRNA reductase